MGRKAIPMDLVKSMHASGLSWRLIAVTIHARTGRKFQPESLYAAFHREKSVKIARATYAESPK